MEKEFKERIALITGASIGISCYEAVFLKTPVIVILRYKGEPPEISKFYSFLHKNENNKLGQGLKNIVNKLREFWNGFEGYF